MASALAKVLLGGGSGASSALIPAIGRRRLQEVVAGSSPASPAAGMSRLIHTGQWRNSLPQQKALPFGSRGVLSQEQKLVRMEQFGSRRWSFYNPFNPGPPDGLPWDLLCIAGAISIAYMASLLARSFWKRYTEEDDYIARLVDDK
ncbi:unnamed protein product [Urochloa decumbens]|uniref:Uncharacterized protein n=1 Tax=Urochloa decumbens TaxID=240449 RepID=A0ABC8VJ18_9POAL